MNGKAHSGFSLIEMLVVVAVIGIIAAIAIPSLISSRRVANEASALSSVRLISSAEFTYQSTAGGGSFGDLANLQNARLIDPVIASATIAGPGTPKSGYLFSAGNIAGLGFPAFDAGGQPSIHTSVSGITGTGTRSFFVNETGTIYFNGNAAAPTCTADVARTVTGSILN